MKRREAIVIMIIVIGGFLSAIGIYSQTSLVAAWPNPYDQYGQGLSSLYVYENSTGSYLNIAESPFYGSESSMIEVNNTPNTALRINPVYHVNITYLGCTINEALDRMRVNLTISLGSTPIYSLNDLANTSASEIIPANGVWYVGYETNLPFLIRAGIYTVVLTYEIYQ